ncbi:tRNA (adenosine(37)-N6)-threonylcarbamoyltransferase complex dimerization subunit type 1 TsaB [Chlamydiota bacterium]
MVILAIETTSKIGALALTQDDIILDEVIISSEYQHSSGMIRALNQLLMHTGISIPSIDVVAVSIGPGSFTGIRIGVAMGMGLSQGLGIPLIGIETMEAMIFAENYTHEKVCVLIDSGRSAFYAGLFSKEESCYVRIKDYVSLAVEDISDYAGDNACFIAGNAEEVIRMTGISERKIIIKKNTIPLAKNVAQLAYHKVLLKNKDVAAKPIYVQPFKKQNIK